jgi:hypothetical protein
MGHPKSKKKKKPHRSRSRRARQQTQGGAPSSHVGSSNVAQAAPMRWTGEIEFDGAIWDAGTRASLEPEVAAIATVIADSLTHVAERRDDDAVRAMAEIPRKSLGGDWRMLIRGLIHWYADEFAEVDKFWGRLDPERRPSRIAQALQLSRSLEVVDGAPSPAGAAGPNAEATNESDPGLKIGAERVHRIRVQRPALAEAWKLTKRASFSKTAINPKNWSDLKRFFLQFRHTDPDLIRAVESNAMALAFEQDDDALFYEIARTVKGSPFDPTNQLIRIQHEWRYHLDPTNTLTNDIGIFAKPRSSRSPAQQEVCQAIASEFYRELAERLTRPSGPFGFMFGNMCRDDSATNAMFERAITTFEKNESAFDAYFDWQTDCRDDCDRKASDEYKTLTTRLRNIAERWCKAHPKSVPARLHRIEQCFEVGEFVEARQHADVLKKARIGTAAVLLLPWKSDLLYAFALARLKKSLANSLEQFSKALAQWPTWLPKTFVPFLELALSVRTGKSELQEQWRAFQTAGPASADVMMLAACRATHVPNNETKELRAMVAEHAKKTNKLSSADLFAVGNFYWDLERIRWSYTGQGSHRKKFGDAIIHCLSTAKPPFDEQNQDMVASAIWVTKDVHFYRPTEWMIKAKSPKLMACYVEVLSDNSYVPDEGFEEVIESLRVASQTDQDMFYRDFFKATLEKAEDLDAAEDANPFSMFFGDNDDDDDDDYDDDESDSRSAWSSLPDFLTPPKTK